MPTKDILADILTDENRQRIRHGVKEKRYIICAGDNPDITRALVHHVYEEYVALHTAEWAPVAHLIEIGHNDASAPEETRSEGEYEQDQIRQLVENWNKPLFLSTTLYPASSELAISYAANCRHGGALSVALSRPTGNSVINTLTKAVYAFYKSSPIVKNLIALNPLFVLSNTHKGASKPLTITEMPFEPLGLAY